MNNTFPEINRVVKIFLIIFLATFLEFLLFCFVLKIFRVKNCFNYDEFFLLFQSGNFLFFSFLLLGENFGGIKKKISDFKIEWNDLRRGVWYFFCLLSGLAVLLGVFYLGISSILDVSLGEGGMVLNSHIFYPPGRFFVYFVSFCFLAPFAEELFFRRLLYVALRARFSFFGSMIISAFFFGIGHVSSPFFAFMAGMYLAYVYEKKHSLIVNTVLHSLMNIIVVVAGPAFFYFS